jgi:hypothetical protein
MSTSSLSGLQREFQQQLLDGGAAEALVKGDARADAATRVGVYADAYRLRLLEVLGNDYPALKRLAGDALFEQLGRAYIESHPSLTPSVRWFGRFLPEFLLGFLVSDAAALPPANAPLPRSGSGWWGAGSPERAWGASPVFADLALFEWKQGEAFDAPDAAAIGIEAVAAVPPESWPEMRLLLHPSLRRLELLWNAPALVQAHQAAAPLPAPACGIAPRAWLLWRGTGLDVCWRSLGADEAAALDAAADGGSFGAICERLCDWVEAEQAALHAAGLLKRWVADGLVVELEGIV